MAFPTETVYGVGAAAFDSQAVQEVFRIKKRPASNPLLVHISNIKQAEQVAGPITTLASKLMEHFWPGPLSLILPAHNNIPALVTGGQSNVGLRMPSHPVAIMLIEGSGPLAATSANLSGNFSPTTAQHVRDDLDGKIAALIDAGPTGIGIESTIIDLSNDLPKVLRLGGIAVEEIEETIGMKLDYLGANNEKPANYHNLAKVILSEDEDSFTSQVNNLVKDNKKVGIVHNNYFPRHMIRNVYKEYELNLSQPGAELFSLLRDAEYASLDVLVFAPWPDNLEGVNKALLDRINKAAGKSSTK